MTNPERLLTALRAAVALPSRTLARWCFVLLVRNEGWRAGTGWTSQHNPRLAPSQRRKAARTLSALLRQLKDQPQ